MKNLDEVDSLLNGRLADSIKEEVLSSEMGNITTTGVTIRRDYRKVIAVGLGDTNVLEQTDLQNIFGKLFQFLKDTDAQRVQVLFDTFKYDAIRPAEAFGLMSVISVHEFESYKTDRKPLFINAAAVTVTGAGNVKPEIERYQKLGRSIAMARDFSET